MDLKEELKAMKKEAVYELRIGYTTGGWCTSKFNTLKTIILDFSETNCLVAKTVRTLLTKLFPKGYMLGNDLYDDKVIFFDGYNYVYSVDRNYQSTALCRNFSQVELRSLEEIEKALGHLEGVTRLKL